MVIYGRRKEPKKERKKITVKEVEVAENKKGKFLGIIMNKEIKFEAQCKEVKAKIIKTNNLLRYINKIG